MPELPELEALRGDLEERSVGAVVRRCELASVAAMKTYAPPLSELVGRTIGGLLRRGKHLCWHFPGSPGSEDPDLSLVVHLARGGWIRWYDRLPAGRARPGRGPLALRVGLDGGSGFDVTEMGTQKRLALWLVADPSLVPGIAGLGTDPLGQSWDEAALAALLDGQSATLKTVLTDQRQIAGIGNAYSDEILHAARLSPFRPAGRLTDDEVHRLYEAVGSVLGDAVARSAGLSAADLKGEKKEGLAVHGRTGQPCPVCGDTVREVSYSERSTQYCPTCQTGGKVLADRRLSRLLK